ncbi:LamG-like jellyroll fold domain-containing protein [Demequina aurantiaca]|uniref:LamG-like jellyroll fold domain-containing protein n=1 Tax=Demequina aurantiaca TaxID=676200 RepID=UPI003D338614
MSFFTNRITRATAGLVATAAMSAAVVAPALAGVDGNSLFAAPAKELKVAAEPDGISSFTLPVIPDTQFYSRYSASQFYPKYGTNPFEVQNQWLVDNQDALNIPFVTHVGDVVDQQGVGAEWSAAAKAMQILTDGGLQYSVVPGNHDVASSGSRSSEANSGNYLANFGTSKLQAQAGSTLVGTFQNGLSSAYIFEAEGQQWMSLAIAWNASDDTFTWAQGILDQYPNTPTILTSHAILNIAQDQESPASWWWGDLLWDSVIKSNDQIIMTVNGHFHGATQRTMTNDFGNPVYQVLTDYQMAADGGNGFLTTLEFDLTNNKIDVETVSPWITFKDPAALTSSDSPTRDGRWQSFSLDLNFQDRFGFSADPGLETKADLSEKAREIVLQGWEGNDGAGERLAAGSAEDYVKVDGTVAHWRFGSIAPGVVDESTEVPDIAGGSPMYRNAPENTDNPDELGDVYVSDSNVAYYASDRGAICFDNVSRNDPAGERLAFISTEYGAPATFADLNSTTGYTLETFLQLDADWAEGDHRWGAAITRGGARQWTGIRDNADAGAGVAWLGISSLREYQFSAGDSDTGNSYTLWSGEIIQSAWHHVAIVNDPVADTAIMYVDGVPVLRNASGVGGMVAADYMPWIIGSSTWDTEMDHGWAGCVGETRVVDHALSPDEFLYNRVDLDAGGSLTIADAPEGELPAGTTVATFSGTGHPGAQVRVDVAGPTQAAAALFTASESGTATTLGRATVGEDGTWSLALDAPIADSGAHSLALVQSLGSRDGAAAAVAFSIVGAATPGGPETPTVPGGDGDPDVPSDNDGGNGNGDADGSGSGSEVDEAAAQADGSGSLATTGVNVGLAVLVAFALACLGLVLVRRSRSNLE